MFKYWVTTTTTIRGREYRIVFSNLGTFLQEHKPHAKLKSSSLNYHRAHPANNWQETRRALRIIDSKA